MGMEPVVVANRALEKSIDMPQTAENPIQLVDLSDEPERFFELLPADWAIELAPYWPEYRGQAQIYGLVEAGQVIAGGVVFMTVTRDIMAYGTAAKGWLDRGYRYIGFLFVAENRRKEGLGSRWLRELQARTPAQAYWLAIDDHGLLSFYQKLGFRLAEKVWNVDTEEWILAAP